MSIAIRALRRCAFANGVCGPRASIETPTATLRSLEPNLDAKDI